MTTLAHPKLISVFFLKQAQSTRAFSVYEYVYGVLSGYSVVVLYNGNTNGWHNKGGTGSSFSSSMVKVIPVKYGETYIPLYTTHFQSHDSRVALHYVMP